MTRPLELNYANATPPADVVIEHSSAGARITIGARKLWHEVILLVIKALAALGLLFPLVIAFFMAMLGLRDGLGMFLGVGILTLVGGLWLVTLFAFIRDLRDFQRVTILEADADGLTWRRERRNRRRIVHIPRERIADLALLIEPRLFWPNKPAVIVSIRLRNDAGIPREARKIWLYNGDIAEGFEIVSHLRDALNISAAGGGAR